MKVLYLPIKKKWFDMILNDEKKEEYREINFYWKSRFNKILESSEKMCVEFRNGYGKKVPTFRIELIGIDIYTGWVEWGAERGKLYYVLELGKILKDSKYENRQTGSF